MLGEDGTELRASYSWASRAARVAVIQIARDRISRGQGRRQPNAEVLDISPEHMLGALALLVQAGNFKAVVHSADAVLESLPCEGKVRGDVLLSAALAHRGLAAAAQASCQVSLAWDHLNRAARALQAAAPQCHDPQLAADIDAARSATLPHSALEQLQNPMTQTAAARRGTVAALREHLTSLPEAALDAQYMRDVIACLTSRELVSLQDWVPLAHAWATTGQRPAWAFLGVLYPVALAHIVLGVLERDPRLVSAGDALLSAVQGDWSVAADRAACAVLLGDAHAAERHGATATSGSDPLGLLPGSEDLQGMSSYRGLSQRERADVAALLQRDGLVPFADRWLLWVRRAHVYLF